MRRSLLIVFMLLLVYVISCASALGNYNDSQTGWNGSQNAYEDPFHALPSFAIHTSDGYLVVNGSPFCWSAYSATVTTMSLSYDDSLMLVIYNVAGIWDNSSYWSPYVNFMDSGTYLTTRILTSTSGTAYAYYYGNLETTPTSMLTALDLRRNATFTHAAIFDHQLPSGSRANWNVVPGFTDYTSSGINPDRYAPDQKCAIYSADGMNTSNSQILLYPNPQPEMGINLASVITKVSTGTATVQINDESVGKYTTVIVISEAIIGEEDEHQKTATFGGDSGKWAKALDLHASEADGLPFFCEDEEIEIDEAVEVVAADVTRTWVARSGSLRNDIELTTTTGTFI